MTTISFHQNDAFSAQLLNPSYVYATKSNIPPTPIKKEQYKTIFKQALLEYDYATLRKLVINHEFKFGIQSLEIIVDSNIDPYYYKSVPMDFLDSILGFCSDELTDDIANDIAKKIIKKSINGEYIEIIYWMTTKSIKFDSTLKKYAESLCKTKLVDHLIEWKILPRDVNTSTDKSDDSTAVWKWYEIDDIECSCDKWKQYYDNDDNDNNDDNVKMK